MSQNLNTLKRTSTSPVYAELKFSDFNPTDEGSIQVRVNLTRKTWRALNESIQNNDNDTFVVLVGELLGLSESESKEFFLSEDDNSDLNFSNWVSRRVMEMVSDHIERNFPKPKSD